MTTTIGASQASIGFTSNYGTYNFIGRWVSDIIGQSSIAANTWTITYGYNDAANATSTMHVTIYVWRPGTGKIGTIFDGDIAISFVAGSEHGYIATFSGSAIASGISSTDVLCCEFFLLSPSPVTQTTYYDGTHVITSNGAVESTAAAYIETPENIALGIIPGVDATSTGKVNTNKMIIKG